MIWKIAIRPDPDAPDTRQGYVRAETERAALQLAGSTHALAWPCPGKMWPGNPNTDVCWLN